MSKSMEFKYGDIIEFAGEQYIVIENFGFSGYVREYYENGKIGDELIKFWWTFDGEVCKLVKSA